MVVSGYLFKGVSVNIEKAMTQREVIITVIKPKTLGITIHGGYMTLE